MKIRPTIAASIIALAAAGISLASTAAYAASPIAVDTWYTADFAGNPSPLIGSGAVGTDGPSPGGPINAIDGPDDGSHVWSINMASAGFVTFVDLETSGDRFDVTVNGVDLGQTSTPVDNAETGVTDIGYALGDPNYSSKSFFLAAGADTFSAEFVGDITFGDADFFVGTGAIPEPATWAMFLVGFGGIGFMLRNRRKGVAATA